MKTLFLAWIAAFGLLCGAAVAQSTQADVSARLIGKPLMMRGFWLDDQLKFDGSGRPLESYKVGSFTEAGLDATSVEVSGDHLTIRGQRVGLAFDKNGIPRRLAMRKSKTFGSMPEKVTIEIDGHGNPDFGRELDAIFADKLSDIAPSLPDYWQPFAREHFSDSGAKVPANPSAWIVHPAQPDANFYHVGGMINPPKLTYHVDPQFSQAARQQKLSGTTRLYLWVGEDGVPSHLAVYRPVGLGLDEQAIAAVSQYRFAPATRDGMSVKVDLYIDVNFQIF